MEQVSLLLAGAQLGITLASLGLGAVAEPAVAHQLERLFDAVGAPDGLLHPVSFVIALLIVVFLHVVLGEMVPKNVALAGPERDRTAAGAAADLVGARPAARHRNSERAGESHRSGPCTSPLARR